MSKDFRLHKKNPPIVNLNIKNGKVGAKIYKNKNSYSQIKRWELAREKKSIWEKYTHDNKTYKLKDFAKKDNPLDKSIAVYDLSVQVDYTSVKGGLVTSPQTFKVITIRNMETTNHLEQNIKTSYENMIYSDTKETFNPGFQEAIGRNTKIDGLSDVRGIENSKNYKLSQEDYISLATGKYVIKDLNKNISASKKKKQASSNKFNVEVDLSSHI